MARTATPPRAASAPSVQTAVCLNDNSRKYNTPHKPDTSRDAWVFPSEALKTPISRDNLWRRHIRPPLDAIGMAWATFQVMRRTHASLMNELKVDPKVVADQLGHTLDVNQNVYTQVALNRRQHAVDTLASAIEHSLLEQMEHKASVN